VDLGHEVVADPLVFGDVAVAVTAVGDWFGVDAESGKIAWRRTGLFTPLAAMSDGARVVALDAKGELVALRPDSGEVVWRAALPVRPPRPSIRPRRILELLATPNAAVAATEEGLTAFSTLDGKVQWKRTLSGVVGMRCASTAFYVTTEAGAVMELSIEGGIPRAKLQLGEGAVSPPCLAIDKVWVGTAGNALIELMPGTLAYLAAHGLPAPMTACPVAFGELLAVPTKGLAGELLYFRPGISTPLAARRLDSALWASPLPMGDALWVPSHDGRVTALQSPLRP
jgi:outer membrane protein assembly factor BamB